METPMTTLPKHLKLKIIAEAKGCKGFTIFDNRTGEIVDRGTGFELPGSVEDAAEVATRRVLGLPPRLPKPGSIEDGVLAYLRSLNSRRYGIYA